MFPWSMRGTHHPSDAGRPEGRRPLLSRRFLLRSAGVLGAASALGVYSVFIERHWVQLTRHDVVLPGLPQAFHGLTIAHLTDLHYGALMSLDAVRDIVRVTNELGVDLIALTGDYVHRRNTSDDFKALKPVLAQLSAPLGVYAVLGNHDHWADTPAARAMLDELGCSLVHRKKALERGAARLWLSGTGDLWEDEITIDEVQRDIPADELRIVLAHNPDTCDFAWGSRVDLMLSGHTHGGQVVLPWYGPPVLPVRNKRYSSGLLQTKKTQLFISRGLGWAIYPVRVNCRPEIAVVRLLRG